MERYGGVDKSLNIWYHGTIVDNLSSILKSGLITHPKRKAWRKDDDASINNPTRKSIEGSIYVTRNLMTAVSSTSNAAYRELKRPPLVAVMQLSDRIMHADEDSVSHGFKKVADEYMLPYIWFSWMFRNGSEEVKKYYDEYLDNWTKNVLLHLDRNSTSHEKARQNLLDYLPTAFEICLKRQLAHFMRQSKYVNYEFLSKLQQVLWENGEYEKYLITNEDETVTINSTILPSSDVEKAENAWIEMMDIISKKARFTVRDKQDYSGSFKTARLTEPVGYSGRNRIVCVFSIPHYREHSRENSYDIHVHYGSLPDDAVQQYTERFTSEFKIVNKQKK